MTPEAKVKSAIKKYLISVGFWPAGAKQPEDCRGWFYMPVSNGMGVHGIPDFVCCYRGRALYIEAKAGDEQPTPNQEQRHVEISAAGGYVVVANDVSQVIDVIKKIDGDIDG